MKRYIFSWVKEDLLRKMVLITGPRQVGKTHLARQFLPLFHKPQYLNKEIGQPPTLDDLLEDVKKPGCVFTYLSFKRYN